MASYLCKFCIYAGKLQNSNYHTMYLLLSIAVLLPIVVGSEAYTYRIDKTLDGSAISHDPSIIYLSNINGTALKIQIHGEILEEPENPENCRNGFGHNNLLEYEVCNKICYVIKMNVINCRLLLYTFLIHNLPTTYRLLWLLVVLILLHSKMEQLNLWISWISTTKHQSLRAYGQATL